jgi:phenylpropionate dioxygenase-like ring-hydroxylating dioxygenase large terminal subunit
MNSAQPIHPHHYVDDRPQEGIFRVHKNVYADPQVFELEIEHIFNKTWLNIFNILRFRNKFMHFNI